jgi:hypothetical protein
MPTAAHVSVGQDVLLAMTERDEPLSLVVTAAHGDRITLSANNDGHTLALRDVAALRGDGATRLQYVDRHGVYDVDASVLQCDESAVVLGVPAAGDPVRRRAYVRLERPLDAACLLLDADHNRFVELDATVVDIGGGGAALSVAAIAPTGTTMVCSISLPSGPPIVTITNVLPSDADPRDHADRRHVRVQFTLIASKDRDRVIAFILDALARARAS